MRVVLDTNILISALIIQTGNPAAIYRGWQEGHFTDVRRASRRIACHAAQTRDRRAYQTVQGRQPGE